MSENNLPVAIDLDLYRIQDRWLSLSLVERWWYYHKARAVAMNRRNLFIISSLMFLVLGAIAITLRDHIGLIGWVILLMFFSFTLGAFIAWHIDSRNRD